MVGHIDENNHQNVRKKMAIAVKAVSMPAKQGFSRILAIVYPIDVK